MRDLTPIMAVRLAEAGSILLLSHIIITSIF
jgi:hypothetical protein